MNGCMNDDGDSYLISVVVRETRMIRHGNGIIGRGI